MVGADLALPTDQHGPAPADPAAVTGLSGAVRPLLQQAVELAGLDVCLLVRRQDEHWVALDAADPDGPVSPGTVLPWDATLCSAVSAGRLPPLVPDLALHPALHRRAAPLGAWFSLPLHDAAGRLLGTLCGGAVATLPRLPEAAGLLRALALACAGLLEGDLALTAADARSALLAPDADSGHHTGLLTPDAWQAQLDRQVERGRALGASSSLLLVALADDAVPPPVRLALLAALGEADALTRLPSGALALLLADAGPTEAAVRALVLGDALAACGTPHRLVTASSRADLPLPQVLVQAEAALAVAPWQQHGDPRPGTVHAPAEQVRALLDRARVQLGQDVAFLSELVDGRQVFRRIVAPPGFPVVEGDSKPAADSLCRPILDGLLPGVMGDVRQHPRAHEVPEVQAGMVGSYLSAPVRLSDGRLYGTVCCLSAAPTNRLSARHALVLQVVADAVAGCVEAELEATSERRLVRDAVAALVASGGPLPVYQPVVATDGSGVVGVEALTRFPDGRGPLPWFREAARHGLGEQLELAAVRAALVALPALATAGRFLSVNLSPAALCSAAVASVLDDVAARGLLGSLVVEVTEHEPVEDYDALTRTLLPWRRRGLRLAVDDAGAGHASLRHVLLLEPDIIKLDRALVTDVERDRTRADLVASLVTFAERSGRLLVAEGVETPAELACLTRLGVHLVQGYYLARPQAEPLGTARVPEQRRPLDAVVRAVG